MMNAVIQVENGRNPFPIDRLQPPRSPTARSRDGSRPPMRGQDGAEKHIRLLSLRHLVMWAEKDVIDTLHS